MAEDAGDREQQQQQQPAAAAGPREDGGGREESAVKLFVGQVPKLMTEAELAAMFRDVALVDEVTVIRDKATKVSRGSSGSVRPNPRRRGFLPSTPSSRTSCLLHAAPHRPPPRQIATPLSRSRMLQPSYGAARSHLVPTCNPHPHRPHVPSSSAEQRLPWSPIPRLWTSSLPAHQEAFHHPWPQ